MQFHFLNKPPDGFDEDRIKSMLMDELAENMAQGMAISAKMSEIMHSLDAYAEQYEKRRGGEDRSPIGRLQVDTIAHLACYTELHKQLLNEAQKREDTEAILAFSEDLGCLKGAMAALKQVS